MTFIERYLNGETQEVYHDIYELRIDAFTKEDFHQIELVLRETFERVAYNLAIIYQELSIRNYQFKSNIKYEWENPLLPPEPDVDKLISQLKSKIGAERYLPVSLEYFFRIVGSCNFCWDWETNPYILWEGADPIDIPPIKTWFELMGDEFDGEEILFAGDSLTKENVSGSGYNLQLTHQPSVDGLLLHEDWDIPFVEYLRITMTNCGFSMADCCDYEDLKAFCDAVRPRLKMI